MGLIGKIVGGTIGLAIGGPLGAIAGVAIGHAYDIGSEMDADKQPMQLSSGEASQFTFFVAAFSMLAKLAKADGNISKEEIDSVEMFMDRDLNLNSQSRRLAVNIFNAAVQSDESFDGFARQFYQQFRYEPQILELMIDIMLRVSVADGILSPSEEELIVAAVRIFDFSDGQYQKIRSKYLKDVDKYYAVLGCNRQDPFEKIKKQYRKLVFEYHPDKVASKGLPQEFTKFAADKFREIQQAYEHIKEERNIR
jgi:DnaJ like chaperone protein